MSVGLTKCLTQPGAAPFSCRSETVSTPAGAGSAGDVACDSTMSLTIGYSEGVGFWEGVDAATGEWKSKSIKSGCVGCCSADPAIGGLCGGLLGKEPTRCGSDGDCGFGVASGIIELTRRPYSLSFLDASLSYFRTSEKSNSKRPTEKTRSRTSECFVALQPVALRSELLQHVQTVPPPPYRCD